MQCECAIRWPAFSLHIIKEKEKQYTLLSSIIIDWEKRIFRILLLLIVPSNYYFLINNEPSGEPFEKQRIDSDVTFFHPSIYRFLSFSMSFALYKDDCFPRSTRHTFVSIWRCCCCCCCCYYYYYYYYSLRKKERKKERQNILQNNFSLKAKITYFYLLNIECITPPNIFVLF